MLMPRFSIRGLLALLTVSAFAFVIAGMAYRGQNWAWGATIGIMALLVTALVHAALFGLVWLFVRTPSAPTDASRGGAVCR